MTEQVEVPKRYQQIDKLVKSWDKAFFLSHPTYKFYIRPRVKGEFYPVEPILEQVYILKVSEKVRVRLNAYLKDEKGYFLIKLDEEVGDNGETLILTKQIVKLLMEQGIEMVATELIPEVD